MWVWVCGRIKNKFCRFVKIVHLISGEFAIAYHYRVLHIKPAIFKHNSEAKRSSILPEYWTVTKTVWWLGRPKEIKIQATQCTQHLQTKKSLQILKDTDLTRKFISKLTRPEQLGMILTPRLCFNIIITSAKWKYQLLYVSK